MLTYAGARHRNPPPGAADMKTGYGIFLGLLFLAACDKPDTSAPSSYDPKAPDNALANREELAENAKEAARSAAHDAMMGQSYEDYFGDADCTGGCDGHNAGFAYAQENDMTDPSSCDGNSQSFIDGCSAFGTEIDNKGEAAYQAVLNGEAPDDS